MPEPSLSEVHADLVGRFQHDERLRHVENAQAAQSATMNAVREEIRGMRAEARDDKAELLAAIKEASAPKPWPAILSAVVAFVVLILVVAERLYS